MNPCIYNYNLMSMEILKIFIVNVEPTHVIPDKGISLFISNPFYKYGHKYDMIETSADLEIIKYKWERNFKYITSFLDHKKIFGSMYYFNSEFHKLRLSFSFLEQIR